MVGGGHQRIGLSIAVAAAIVAFACAGATSASASTIVYQCGGYDVCAVDPDSADGPHTLTSDGRVAGVTRDGKTAAWVASNPIRIVKSPLAGGAETTLFTGEVYDFPQISPNGSKVLWTWFFAGYGWYTYAYSGPPPPPPAGQYPPAVASSTYQTTAGWMGEEPIITVRGNEAGTDKAKICKAVAGGPNCDTLLATDPDSQLSFPDTAPDGSTVVAIRGPASGFGTPVFGTIALYSTQTQTRIRDVMPGAGQDTHPVFSADGNRIAFERDGGIWVVGVTGGEPRRIATGTTPFWGGARTPSEPTGPTDPLHTVKLKLLGKPRIKALRTSGLRLQIADPPAGKATARLTVAKAIARRIGLGKRTTLATAGAAVAAGQPKTLRLRATGWVAKKLKRARPFKATIQVTVKPPSGNTVSKRLTVRLSR